MTRRFDDLTVQVNTRRPAALVAQTREGVIAAAHMSAQRTERLLNLLTLLLNTRRPISLRELREHEEFAAYNTADPSSGERAFERDKAALIELGVPLRWVAPEQDDDEDGLGGYLIDKERYYLPELKLEPSDLAMLSIAGAAAAAIDGFPGREAVIRALAKLGFEVDGAPHSTSLAHAPIRVGGNPARVAKHLELLHDAVARRATVDVTYTPLQGPTTQRCVDPYGLFYRQGVWYLVGRCHLRNAERTFHLGRLDKASLARPDKQGSEFEVPTSFDISEHAGRRPWEIPVEPPIAVEILLAERLVPALAEIFGPRATMRTTVQGTLIGLVVKNRAALVAALLPFGADAEVRSPQELRARMSHAYDEMLRSYKSADESPADGMP